MALNQYFVFVLQVLHFFNLSVNTENVPSVFSLINNTTTVPHNSIVNVTNLLIINNKTKTMDYTTTAQHLKEFNPDNRNIIAKVDHKFYEELKNLTRSYYNNRSIIDLKDIVLDLEFDETKEALADQVEEHNERSVTTDVNELHTTNNNLPKPTKSCDLLKEIIKQVRGLNVNKNHKENKKVKEVSVSKDEIDLWKPTKDEERHLNNTRRIFDPGFTRIKKFPFMASVHVFHRFTCGGSIISRDLVITAASCLQTVQPKNHRRRIPRAVSVRIGSNHASHDGQLIFVSQVNIHPLYDPPSLRHNLALLRLESPLVLRHPDRRVRRVAIGRAPIDPMDIDDRGVMIVGWGQTGMSDSEESPEHLQFTELELYNHDECKEVYSDYYVTNRIFCGGYGDRGGGACNKDVGNPGLMDGILVGVVSFGAPDCGTPDGPTAFTNIGYYTRWIDSIMTQDTKPKQKSPPVYDSQNDHENRDTTKSYTENANFNEEIPDENFDALNFRADENSFLEKVLEKILNSQDFYDADLGDGGNLPNEGDDTFKTTIPESVLDHELINKSMFPIVPDIPIIEDSEYTTRLSIPPFHTITFFPQSSIIPTDFTIPEVEDDQLPNYQEQLPNDQDQFPDNQTNATNATDIINETVLNTTVGSNFTAESNVNMTGNMITTTPTYAIQGTSLGTNIENTTQTATTTNATGWEFEATTTLPVTLTTASLSGLSGNENQLYFRSGKLLSSYESGLSIEVDPEMIKLDTNEEEYLEEEFDAINNNEFSNESTDFSSYENTNDDLDTDTNTTTESAVFIYTKSSINQFGDYFENYNMDQFKYNSFKNKESKAPEIKQNYEFKGRMSDMNYDSGPLSQYRFHIVTRLSENRRLANSPTTAAMHSVTQDE